MVLSWDFILTFGALALSVLALWVPAPQIRGSRSWLWSPLLAAACILGVVTGFLTWAAPCWVAGYAGLAIAARDVSNRWLRIPLLCATWVAPFLFAAHRFPGFHNPTLAEGVQFSPGAPAYSVHVNFDMAAVGVILAGVFCERLRTFDGWAEMLRRVWPILVSTLVFVLGIGMLVGYVRSDPKWTPYSLFVLTANLLFTCVTEEAFFRGFTLVGLEKLMSKWRFGTAIAAVVSAVLFGLAHVKGGPVLIALATIAGLHYATAFVVTRRIEGAILAHFVLNAVHFIGFTYPNLIR
ncbi:lysostaphin resistance A-like protein [Massilia sp.]|uniref:CPBP family intramembrane glutamic endopeptidase n=1 Tax=Massilia sp. TaxID=1882437 RepID=UPI00352D1AD1